jgi:hypothetical protein
LSLRGLAFQTADAQENQMGQWTAVKSSPQAAPMFVVGQDDEGHWIVRDSRGLSGGLFVDKAAAIRFAAFESNRRPQAVLFVPEHIRLSLSGSLPALP